MDDYLDQFCEDHLNGGYGDILDQLADAEYETEIRAERVAAGQAAARRKGKKLAVHKVAGYHQPRGNKCWSI